MHSLKFVESEKTLHFRQQSGLSAKIPRNQKKDIEFKSLSLWGSSDCMSKVRFKKHLEVLEKIGLTVCCKFGKFVLLGGLWMNTFGWRKVLKIPWMTVVSIWESMHILVCLEHYFLRKNMSFRCELLLHITSHFNFHA